LPPQCAAGHAFFAFAFFGHRFRRLLADIRQAGFAHYERPDGHVAAAVVPLPLHRDDLLPAIGVYCPRVRTPADGDGALRTVLSEAAARIATAFANIA
jgi:DNA-binding IclR family transcriptional regulator